MSVARRHDGRPGYSTPAREGARVGRIARGGRAYRATRLIAIASGAALAGVVAAPTATATWSEYTAAVTGLAPATSDADIVVNDGLEMTSSIVGPGETNIFFGGDVMITDTLVMSGGGAYTISSGASGSGRLTRSPQFDGPIFSVEDNATVTIVDLEIDGGATVTTGPISHGGRSVTSPLVENYGDLRLGSGARLANNWVDAPAEAGGCVYNEGTLVVEEGATITGCSNGTYGGGAILNHGTVDMTGGLLSGNVGTGGAIQNADTGTVRLTGGTIVGNANAWGDTDAGDSGILNEGLLEVSGSIVLGDAADQGVDNTVLSPGSPVVVTGALSGHVSVAVGASPTDGHVIAVADNPGGVGYSLTASDAAVFSVRGYSTRLDAVQNAVVLTAPSPQVTDVDAAPDSLGPGGGDSAITITGTNLPATFEVAAFDGNTPAGVVATASTSGAVAQATLTFPQNASATARVYTVGVSFDGGASWLTQPTADVTVAAVAQPTLADRDNNTISAPTQVTAGAAFSFTARGDRQDAAGAVIGDERYVPSRWQINPSGAFVLDAGVYTGSATVAHPGDYTLTVTYVLQSFDGTAWTSTGTTDTKTVGISGTAVPARWNGRSLPLTGTSGVLGWVVAAAAVAGAGALLSGAARRADR